jgi:SAM-dependent methyltransferase
MSYSDPMLTVGPAVYRSAEDFDAWYQGTPPWEIGGPQPAFVALADSGAIVGRVLDAGCGTGDNALMLAARGFDVTGLDAAPTAIRLAEAKATERGLKARFVVGNALDLDAFGDQFDTVIDSALFHVFDDERRPRYVQALAAVLPSGGRYLMCCFSDRQPGQWGPRRVTQDEIRVAFAHGWNIESIEPAELRTTIEPGVAQAWTATITRG